LICDPRNQEKSNPPDKDPTGPNKGSGEDDRVRGLLHGCHHPVTCYSEVTGVSKQVAGGKPPGNSCKAHDGVQGPKGQKAATGRAAKDLRDHTKPTGQIRRFKWQKLHVTAATFAYAQLKLRAQVVTAAKEILPAPDFYSPLDEIGGSAISGIEPAWNSNSIREAELHLEDGAKCQ
jgi:hypothetical protein